MNPNFIKNKKQSYFLILGTTGLPGNYGGWDPLLNNFVHYFSDENLKIVIFTPSTKKNQNCVLPLNIVREFVPFKANGIQKFFFDFYSLIKALKYKGVIFIFGSSGVSIFFMIFRILGLNIINNIDGEEWKRDKWPREIKFILWISYIFSCLFSSHIIADHPEILSNVKKFRKKNISCIEYGTSHLRIIKDSKFPPLNKSCANFSELNKKEYFLTICRIEPENNLHLILKVFSELNQKILIIGNWDSSEYGKKLKSAYKNFKHIILGNACYDKLTLESLRKNAKGYVHGHTVGGTNPSLLEAMFYELPIFAHDNKYNRYVTRNKAFYFKSEKDLKKIITKSDANNLKNCKLEMKKIVNNNYKWDEINSSYFSLFKKYNQ